jgi:plasmid stability protein
MKKNTLRQYTIRNIPESVDLRLKRKAKESGKSFNQTALEALTLGTGQSLRPNRDFTEIIGSISSREAEKLDEEIRLQRQIDPDLWK